MKNLKITTSLVIIALVTIISVGIYLVYALVIGRQPIESTSINIVTPEVTTADWLTYIGGIITSDDVTFKYPQGWEIHNASTLIFQGPEVKEIILSSKANNYRLVLKKYTSPEDQSKYFFNKRSLSNIKTRDGLTFNREYIFASKDKENIFKYSAVLKFNNQEYLFYHSVGDKNFNDKNEIAILDKILSTISFRISNDDLENYRNSRDQIEGEVLYSSVDLGLDFKYNKASIELNEVAGNLRKVTSLELINKKESMNTLLISRALNKTIEQYTEEINGKYSGFKKNDDRKIDDQLWKVYNYNSSSEIEGQNLTHYLYLTEHNEYLYILSESILQGNNAEINSSVFEDIFTTLKFNNKINFKIINDGCCKYNLGRNNYTITSLKDWQDIWLKMSASRNLDTFGSTPTLPNINVNEKTIAAIFYDQNTKAIRGINSKALIDIESIVYQNDKAELNASIITKNQDCDSIGLESPYIIIEIDKPNMQINYNFIENAESCD